MYRQHLNKKISLFGAICGSLLFGLPATVQPASAQVEAEPLNPCPEIYYEEPFDSSTLVPEDCPPNAISQQLGVNQETAPAGITLGNPEQIIIFQSIPDTSAVLPLDTPALSAPTGSASAPAQPPLPEQRSEPVAMVMPTNGTIEMQLTNNTNTAVYYQVLGETAVTERQMLKGGESTVLTNLPTPLTLTAERADNGFLEFIPVSSQAGALEVSLNEDATPLDSNEGTLRIQEDGQIFLN
jgi:hypothetical protein